MNYTVQIGDFIGFTDKQNGITRIIIEDSANDWKVQEHVTHGNESSLLRVAAALQKYLEENE